MNASGSGLTPFRERLDAIDGRIMELFARRFDVCRQIAAHKHAHDIPMMQGKRVVQVREHYLRLGAELHVPVAFTVGFFDLLIAATCEMEEDLIAATEAAESHRS
ncbi:MAG TPA: chorismate mutase [Solirubrobacteraceae bacterium]